MDERVVGRPHHFGYTAAIDKKERPGFSLGSALLKHDRDAGTCEARTIRGGAGEAIFVPASDTTGEDDGFVLSLVYDSEREASDLLVLHAQDFTGDPAAVVHLPVRVPYGFHGNWVPDA